MRTDDYLRSQAAECETNAAKMVDQVMRDQWLRMADHWRALLAKRATTRAPE